MAKNGNRVNGATTRSPNSHDDEVKFERNGTITIFEGGRGHHLVHPTVGQLRAYGDDFNQLQRDQAAARDAAEAEPADGDTAPEYDAEVFTEQWLAWWRLVFEGDEGRNLAPLDRDQCPLPDDSDLIPGWLLDPQLVSECFKVWRTVPWAGGTSPAQTKEAALTAQLKEMGPALGPLLQAIQGTGLGGAAGLTQTATGSAAQQPASAPA